jgi:hypothetical protein
MFFGIPLKSKKVSSNWPRVTELLNNTLRSIFNQTDPDFIRPTPTLKSSSPVMTCPTSYTQMILVSRSCQLIFPCLSIGSISSRTSTGNAK